MRKPRAGIRDLAMVFSGIVMTVVPVALGASACSLGNQNKCGGGGGGGQGPPVTVPYTPLVCTTPEASTPEAGAASDASDSDAPADAADLADATDVSDAADATAAVDATASVDASPPPCVDTDMCRRLCGVGTASCTRGPDDAGVDSVTCIPQPQYATCGRRFAGLRRHWRGGATPLGAFFAESAYLEEASITSFEILADELAAHGAPDALVRDASRSARDEVRHARTMTALATRHGASVDRVRVRRRAVRPLEQVVRENAVEGCVRETFGALLATFQATHASCPKVRAAMRRIARDETRHAALAWTVDAWASSRLRTEERAALTRARKRAVAKLARELASEPHPSLVREAGMPTAAQAAVLLNGLSRELGLTGAESRRHADS